CGPAGVPKLAYLFGWSGQWRPLFWPLASFQTRSRRSGPPSPRPRTQNPAGHRTRGIEPSQSRGPKRRKRNRTEVLSMLRPRPSRLHPQAHPKKSPRTMTHFSSFQDRLSFLRASLRRHSLTRPADHIIFLPVLSKPSTDLHCPAAKPRKSVATDQSATLSAKT